MRREGAGDAAAEVAAAERFKRRRLDLGRQVAFFQRVELAGVMDDVGVGDAAIGRRAGRRVGQGLAEAAVQRAAGVVLGHEFWRADPAVAVARLAVLEMEGVQHAVADEPVR